MRPDLAAGLVAYTVQVWPRTEIGEHTVEAWADATGDLDPTSAHTAMRRIAATDEWPPSIARFMAVYRLIEREATPPAVGPGPVTAAERDVVAARWAVLRAFWKSAQKSRPDCDHRDRSIPCPRCSTRDEWLSELAPQAMAVVREAS